MVTVVRDSDGIFAIEPDASRKFTLNNSLGQASVRAFFEALAGFLRNNNINQIVIRGRQAKGPFAGGSVSFKIEGFLQLVDGCTATILTPSTIKALMKRHKPALPSSACKYQEEAFFTACSALIKVTK